MRKFDFSIADGKIGAPTRKPRDASGSPEPAKAAKLDIPESHVRVKVKFEGRSTQEFALPVDSSFEALESMVLELTGSDKAYQKIFHSGTLLQKSEDGDGGALQGAGVKAGGTLLVVCTSQKTIDDVHAADHDMDKWDGVRTFEQEEELAQRRADAAPMYARPATGSLNESGFSRIEPLVIDPVTAAPYTSPPPEEARKLLESLAADRGIQAIMKRRGWRVGLLTELPPSMETGLIGKSGTCLLGLNKNNGEEILLRLRTSDFKGFRPVYAIMETLIHELCHIVHSEHDHKFWALFSELKKEAGVSDWTKTKGRTVGGWAARRDEGSATSKAQQKENNVGNVLGGHAAAALQDAVPADPRDLAAIAAQSRIQKPWLPDSTAPTKSASASESESGSKSATGPAHAPGPRAHKEPDTEPTAMELDGPRGQPPHPPTHTQAQPPAAAPAPEQLEDGGGRGGRGADPMPVSPLPDEEGVWGGAGGWGGEQQQQPAPEAHKGAPEQAGAGGDAGGGGFGVEMLVGMGFPAEAAERALAKFHGSVERAADWLFGGGGEADHAPAASMKTENAAQGPPQQAAQDSPGEDKEMAELRGGLEKALERMIGGIAPDWAAAGSAMQTLLTILRNILQHPSEDKYRKIRLMNAAFQSKVGRHVGGVEFLEHAKFRRSADHSVVECARADAAALYVACGVLERAVEALPAQ